MTLFFFALLVIMYGLGIVMPLALYGHIRERLKIGTPGPDAPPAGSAGAADWKTSVILPFKGIDKGFEENIRCFMSQDHPDYEVVMVMEDRDDEAYNRVEAIAAKYPNVRVKVALSKGVPALVNKMRNTLKGIEESDPESRYIVIANGDVRPHPNWLRNMVKPMVADESVGITTTYFLSVPEKGGLWSRLFSFLAFCGLPNFIDSKPWGLGRLYGVYPHATSMGLPRTVVDRIFPELRVLWARVVVDDLSIGDLVKDLGYSMRFVPESMVYCSYDCGFPEMWHMMKRYLVAARYYIPTNFWLGMVVTMVPVLASIIGVIMILSAPLTGMYGLCALALVMLIPIDIAVTYQWRVPRTVREGMPHLVDVEKAIEVSRWYPLLLPIGLLVLSVLYPVTALSDTFIWKGKTFLIKGPLDVVRLER